MRGTRSARRYCHLLRRVEDQPHLFQHARILDVIVKPPKYTRLPMPRVHVDALQPPKDAAAPIGQLKGHHRLRDHLAVSFNNEISAEVWTLRPSERQA